MKTHYCRADRDWITFEHICAWCGLEENQVGAPMTDDEFRQMMAKLEADANPNINDD